MNIRIKPLAALLPVLLSSPSGAVELLATLDPVIVAATRQPTRASELVADVSVIERKDIETASHAATLGELLSREAGIEFSREGGRGASESVFVRGTNTSHTLVLLDGLRVGSATLGTTALNTIPLSQIERIEIVRGTASALYGTDAIGGVINIITRSDKDAPRLELEAGGGSHGTYQTSAAHAGQFGDFRYALRVGADGSDGINAVRNRSSAAYNADRDGYAGDNLSLNLGYAPSKAFQVGGHYLQSRTETHYDASWPTANADWRNQHLLSSMGAFAQVQPLSFWQSTLRVGRGTDKSVNRPGSDFGVEKDSFVTIQDQFSWQNDFKLPVGNALLIAERLEQRVEASQSYALTERSINSLQLGWNGNYKAHRLQANVRHDANSQFGHKNTQTLGYGYQLADAWRIAAGYGTAFKAPTLNDLYYPNTPFVGVGNPSLQPEFARNREVALHFESNNHRASLTYFRNNVSNLIQWEETSPGSWFYTPKNVGQARIEGLTLQYRAQYGDWQFHGNLNYQDAENAETGKQLTRRAQQFATLGLTHRIGAFDWGGEWHGSGQRYDDAANTRELAGYGILNLHARYQLEKGVSLFARVDNLFDKRFEYARSSTTNYGNMGTVIFAGIRYTLK